MQQNHGSRVQEDSRIKDSIVARNSELINESRGEVRTSDAFKTAFLSFIAIGKGTRNNVCCVPEFPTRLVSFRIFVRKALYFYDRHMGFHSNGEAGAGSNISTSMMSWKILLCFMHCCHHQIPSRDHPCILSIQPNLLKFLPTLLIF